MDANFNAGSQSQPPPFPGSVPPPFPGSVPPPFPPQEPPSAPAPTSLPPARSEAEFVEAERMNAGDAPLPGARGRVVGIAVSGEGRPPRLWAWLLLIAAWLFLASSTLFTVFIGVPINLAALIFAAVCLARGGVFTGLAVMLLGTAGSLAVYFVGWARFLGELGS